MEVMSHSIFYRARIVIFPVHRLQEISRGFYQSHGSPTRGKPQTITKNHYLFIYFYFFVGETKVQGGDLVALELVDGLLPI
jgi:hypothetical protein